MATYRTPDVYIEETSTLPPSVAEVSTAIPAFFGYTELVTNPDGEDLIFVHTRINTLLDYIAIFGKQNQLTFTATANEANELMSVEKEDEPTLIVLSEATTLLSLDYHNLCQDALNQCEKLKDRFCIFDVLNDKDGVSNFRSIVNNNLKYGAAYYPFLQTSIVYQYDEKLVTVNGQSAATPTTKSFIYQNDVLKVEFTGPVDATPTVEL